jgi:hypothetical protein
MIVNVLDSVQKNYIIRSDFSINEMSFGQLVVNFRKNSSSDGVCWRFLLGRRGGEKVRRVHSYCG